MNDDAVQRASAALARIRNKGMREEIARACEAMADAFEMMPTGSGTSDVRSGGFESTTPGPVAMAAAEAWRKGRADLTRVAESGRRLLTIARRQGTGSTHYELPAKGKAPVLTAELIARAREVRRSHARVTPTIKVLSREFGPSESALWRALEKGSEPVSPPSIERLFYIAVYQEGESSGRRDK